MSLNRMQAGGHADAPPAPAPLDRYAVLRSLDKERLLEEAPDVPRERIHRIVRVRDELRRGVYVTEERVEHALGRALDEIDPPGSPEHDLERSRRLS